MTIKQCKQILYFLEAFMVNLESHQDNQVNPEFLNLFSRKELVEMVLWLDANYDKSMLTEKTDSELLELLNDTANVLAYIIEQWKNKISAVPKLSQTEVNEFFDAIQIDPHYLRDKPVNQWNQYDVSNYYSILFRHGKTKRVFAIFTADVAEKDKYAVTTKPSFFFDTKQEAEVELRSIIADKKIKKEELKIMSLWQIN